MTTVTKPIYYRPIERHWYRIADFVQHTWHRFASSRTGRFTIWFVSRLMWVTIKVVLKLAFWLGAAIFVVGLGVLFVSLSTALGGGALGKGVKRGNR